MELCKKVGRLDKRLNSLLQTVNTKQTINKNVGAVITLDSGYEWGDLTLKLSPANWQKVKSGKHFKIRGKGWRLENEVKGKDYFNWDYWEFYGGIGKNFKVLMKYNDGDEELACDELLLSEYIAEYTVEESDR